MHTVTKGEGVNNAVLKLINDGELYYVSVELELLTSVWWDNCHVCGE